MKIVAYVIIIILLALMVIVGFIEHGLPTWVELTGLILILLAIGLHMDIKNEERDHLRRQWEKESEPSFRAKWEKEQEAKRKISKKQVRNELELYISIII